MAMTLIKKTNEYSIYRRGDARYAVKNAHSAPVNGDDKTAILLQEGLIDAPKIKAPEPAPAAEDAPEAGDTPTEEGDA